MSIVDDDSCMEVTALKGSSGDAQHFAEAKGK
jgi:metal-responsive CopG/Arc/MetJ family transcriptional regulator